MSISQTPRVFISYSHDNSLHKDWVRHLAENLQRNGVETLLDQWDLEPGEDITHFMEKGLSEANRVLAICTQRYVEKANTADGGVGAEKLILTAQRVSNHLSSRIIPLIREGEGDSMVPIFLANRLHIDFRDDSYFKASYDTLLGPKTT